MSEMCFRETRRDADGAMKISSSDRPVGQYFATQATPMWVVASNRGTLPLMGPL